MAQPQPMIDPIERIKKEPLGPPNNTIYVQNLNERVKIPDLKNSLF